MIYPILSAVPAQRELNLTIVDGFCGGGAYTHAGVKAPGSPLLLLRAVRAAEVEQSALRKNGFEVRADFFFIDHLKHHVEFLRSELEASEFNPELGRSIHLVQAAFEDRVASIIGAIQAKGSSHRALFLLDQYGWSDVSFASVRQIFAQLNNPEVVITFPVDSLIRSSP